MDYKKLLPYQRSLFILGDAGSERYSLFRSLASNKVNLERFWHPEDMAFKQSTWVLFSADEALSYKATEKGLQEVDKIIAGGTYYLSVLPGQLPVNVKLVFPPYFTSEIDFTTYYEQQALLTPSSTFIWFEGFPYGKADTVQQLRYLQDIGVEQKRISVAITQIERNFVLSDVGDMQLGIDNAIRYIKEKQYRVLHDYAKIPVQRELLFEALRVEIQFSKGIVEQKQQFLEQLKANMLFVEDDLELALENEEWVIKLENCFSYAHVKNSKNILDVWQQQFKKLFYETLQPTVLQELLLTYELEQIQDEQWTERELSSIIESLWNELTRKLRLLNNEASLKQVYTSQMQYELKILPSKTKCYKEINDIVQRRLLKEVTLYLEKFCKKYTVLV